MEARGAEYGAEAHEYEAAESDSDDEEDLRTCVLQAHTSPIRSLTCTN